jgi:hypothetical protein
MLTQTLYICSTGSILTGTIMTFDKDSIPDYFFLVGTSLFFIKASICFVNKLISDNDDNNRVYPELVY